jgi:hypothetical protein
VPHANVWIRKKDWAKWKEIDNKAEFISNALGGTIEDSSKQTNKVSISELKKIPGIITAEELTYEKFKD